MDRDRCRQKQRQKQTQNADMDKTGIDKIMNKGSDRNRDRG